MPSQIRAPSKKYEKSVNYNQFCNFILSVSSSSMNKTHHSYFVPVIDTHFAKNLFSFQSQTTDVFWKAEVQRRVSLLVKTNR